MMTKMSMSMGPEGFLMAKEHQRLMAGTSGRMEKLLGIFPNPSDSGDLNDLKEEEVWGAWPKGGSNGHSSVYKEAEKFHSKTESLSSEAVGRFIHHKNNKNGRQQQKWLGFETGGLSVAFEDSNIRSRLTSAMKGAGRSMSIPHAQDNSNTRHMMHQSAPVNVPDWTKILGMDHRKDDNPFVFNEEDDKLPPHEYLAREQMTTSVFRGVGRTLKGRDMSRVRNAVWTHTGFLG